MTNESFCITFSGEIEHDYKSEILSAVPGTIQPGLNRSTILKFLSKFPKAETEFIDLGATVRASYEISDELAEAVDLDDAVIGVIRNGVELLGINTELVTSELKYNITYTDKMKGRSAKHPLVTKRMRHTAVLADHGFAETLTVDPVTNAVTGSCEVTAFAAVPTILALKDEIERRVLKAGWATSGGQRLWAEVNRYFDSKNCGISPHTDGERRVVIGTNFGEATRILTWYGFINRVYVRNLSGGNNEPLNSPFYASIILRLGDLYLMGDCATGFGNKSLPRRNLFFKHAAGLNPKLFIPNGWLTAAARKEHAEDIQDIKTRIGELLEEI